MPKQLFYTTFLVFILSIVNLNAQDEARTILDPQFAPFYHGVASGDPLPNSMMIWTRVTPDSGSITEPLVYWQVATDINFNNIVNFGNLNARADRDYTVKIDVCGLQPNTYYYFMFQSDGRNSLIGRTKTAPVGVNSRARFGVASCSSYEHGYFNAYESMTDRNDLDAIIHLGDYIYEYNTGGFAAVPMLPDRVYEPAHEIISLSDYRVRHSHYKLDDQLRRLHQMYPFITVWDDHETANDAWKDGAGNHTPGTEGPFTVRKTNSTRAYDEWMPIRRDDPMDTMKIYRRVKYGDLMDLIMLDTRLIARDEQDLGDRNNPSRTLLGAPQLNWLKTQLADTNSLWKIIGQQVMFAPTEFFGTPFNADQWDGYNPERDTIKEFILNNPVDNVVILTGDIHTTWVNDIPGNSYDASTGSGSVAVEFVATSVTSQSSPIPVADFLIQIFNPHVKEVDLTEKGYYVLDVTPTKTQADYVYVDNISSNTFNEVAGESWYVLEGERHLREATSATSSPTITAPVPSAMPDHSIAMAMITDTLSATIQWDETTTFCWVPVGFSCPNLAVNILQAPNNGTQTSLGDSCITYTPNIGYCGGDTIVAEVCQTTAPFKCDTVYAYVEVTLDLNTETIFATVYNDSAITLCNAFDDLPIIDSIYVAINPTNGSVSLVNDSCIAYTPNVNFCGDDYLIIVACQNSPAKCDTIIYDLFVRSDVTATYLNASIKYDSTLNMCGVYDDLVAAINSASVSIAPSGIATIVNDTCIEYTPAVGFRGTETITHVVCDNNPFPKCDTTIYTIDVSSYTDVPTPANLVVFGVYPNPFSTELVIQYYLHETDAVKMKLIDANGKVVYNETLPDAQSGLQYAKLDGKYLPKGSYVFVLESSNHQYRKVIIKAE